MNKQKFAYIAELVWLLVAIVSLITSAFEIYKNDTKTALPFIIITFVAGLMYGFRRYLRHKKN